jgi:Xaa-Pro aminopeptidase
VLKTEKTASSADYPERIGRLRAWIAKTKAEGFLITDPHNLRYLSGFTGSSGFGLITHKSSLFVTDFRYQDQAHKEVTDFHIDIEKGDRIKTIEALTRKFGIKKLGIESSVTYEFFKRLSDKKLSLMPQFGVIEKMRAIKNAFEIQCIREATLRAEAAFLDIKPYIRQGKTERELALRLDEKLKEKGCRRIPFEIIVASGKNSALPHAQPTEKRLNPGDFVIFDWGGEANGYYSDMTRTYILKGGNIQKQKQIYSLVLHANKKALACIASEVKSRVIDAEARNLIKNAGFGSFFGHGTGHGVGLQVHEEPRITWAKSKMIKKNMVFTIEPGIYIPDLGGVRIEDIAVVKHDGAEVLTSLPKNLEII